MSVFNAPAIVNKEIFTTDPSMADINVPMAVIGRIFPSGIIKDSEGFSIPLFSSVHKCYASYY